MAKDYRNTNVPTRGLRNNNPGNLIMTTIDWVGKVPNSQNKDGKFEQFVELRYGIRALMRDIVTDIKKGKNTIQLLINEFAPDFENNTANYISFVASAVNLSPFKAIAIATLSDTMLIALCKAIVRMENGIGNANTYITDQDYADAIAILGDDIPLIKKKVQEQPL